MCKFESADAPGYRQVSTAIVEWVQEAPGFISVRWNVEDEDRRVRVQLEINERARPYVSCLLLLSTDREYQIVRVGESLLIGIPQFTSPPPGASAQVSGMFPALGQSNLPIASTGPAQLEEGGGAR